jgi:hypothetical protein
MTYLTGKAPPYTPRPWIIERIRRDDTIPRIPEVPLQIPLDDEEDPTVIIHDDGREAPESGYEIILPDDDTVEIVPSGIETLL